MSRVRAKDLAVQIQKQIIIQKQPLPKSRKRRRGRNCCCCCCCCWENTISLSISQKILYFAIFSNFVFKLYTSTQGEFFVNKQENN